MTLGYHYDKISLIRKPFSKCIVTVNHFANALLSVLFLMSDLTACPWNKSAHNQQYGFPKSCYFNNVYTVDFLFV